jgi:hypothetical protein
MKRPNGTTNYKKSGHALSTHPLQPFLESNLIYLPREAFLPSSRRVSLPLLLSDRFCVSFRFSPFTAGFTSFFDYPLETL